MKEKSPIRQMLYGQRRQMQTIKTTEEYHKITEKLVENDDALREKLAGLPELLELYGKVKDSLGELNLEEAAAHYAEGFKFGLLIGLETAGD